MLNFSDKIRQKERNGSPLMLGREKDQGLYN